jgi:tetratricopeptide (TPR) repeat protein
MPEITERKVKMSKARAQLGQRIRKRRQTLGFSQRQLAGNHFSRVFISEIERGRLTPSLSALAIIANRLGTTMAVLLGEDADDPLEIEAHLAAVERLLATGDHHAAAEKLQQALTLASEHPDSSLLARAQHAQGRILLHQGAYKEASQTLEEASHNFLKADHPLRAGQALDDAGTAWLQAGDTQKAVVAYESALRLFHRIRSSQRLRSRSHANLAIACERDQQYERALPLLKKALEWAYEAPEYYRLGDIHLSLGIVYEHLNRVKEAIAAYTNAESCFAAVADQTQCAQASYRCGLMYRIRQVV